MIDFQEDGDKLDFQLDFQEEPSGKSGNPTPVAEESPGMFDFLTGSARKGHSQAPAAALMQQGAQGTTALAEGAGVLGTGAAGGMLAPVPAALKSMNSMGDPNAPSFERNYADAMDSMTYHPRTEKGQDVGDAIGTAINRVGIPLMGLHLGSGGAAMRAGAESKVIGDLGKSVPKETVLDRLKAKQAEIDSAKALEKAKEPLDFQELKSTEGEGGQMALFDQEQMRQPNTKYEAVPGEWRTDENGMPIKADLSMEAANMEQPLQRNLFGDELGRKAEQEAKPLTEAIDSMDPNVRARSETGTFAKGYEKDNALNLLRGEIMDSTHELKNAVRDAQELPAATRSGDSSMNVPKSQRGAINPEVFAEGFQKLKQLADGAWVRAFGDGRSLNVEVIKDGHKLGETSFDAKWGAKEQNLEAAITKVSPEHQGKGYAKEMYKFASELGNDIRASYIQTPEGTRMWNGFEKKGFSTPDGYIPKKQRGAVYFGDPAKKQLQKTLGIKDKAMIPEDPKAVDVIAAASGDKDGRSLKYMDSGATLTAMKRNSSLIRDVGDMIGNAVKRAEFNIREKVFPAETALRKLSHEELNTLGEVFKDEMLNERKFDGKAMVEAGMSTKQIEAYTKVREMFDDNLRVQNEARAAKGQEPITAKEAYLSSRWSGDFRRPIYDANGKLVWYLAADTKFGLNTQTKALLKEHPEFNYKEGKDHVVRYVNRKTDLESAYSTMLDVLGRDDPAVNKLKEFMEDSTVGRGATFLNQEKHFKEKGNIRGFVGDRPGKSPNSEFLALFQQQIQYAKNGYQWSELQKTGQVLKEVLNDPTLTTEQPKNISYIREYFKHAIGYGESRAMRAIEDSIRDVGVSPAPFDKAVGGMKSFFILQKLGFNAGFGIANLAQTSNVLPHLADLYTKGYKGNPITALAAGMFGSVAMTTGHYINAAGKQAPKIPGMEFFNKAFKYAEDNGTTARSMVDESPIESSFSTLGQLGKVTGKTVSAPETVVRSFAFTAYAQFLKDSGKFKGDDMALFQEAERRTNASMVDYRATERPMIFDKMGSAGNFLNTLQTYGFNFYNQYSYFTREAMRGNPAPLLAALAVQTAVAGAFGVPYAEDIYKLTDVLKNTLPTTAWMKLQSNKFLSDPKLWMLEHFGEASVYGVLSDKTGLGLTSRVTPPGMNQMLQSPAGPAMDIAKQAGSVISAAADPTNTTKLGQAAMNVVPPGLQGMLETSPMMEGITHDKRPDGNIYTRNSDLADHKGLYVRSPKDETIRKFGLRSQDEVVQRDLTYSVDKTEQQIKTRSKGLMDDFYDAAKRGDKAKMTSIANLYTKMTGEEITSEKVEGQIRENYLTQLERAKTGNSSVQTMVNIARMQKFLDERKAKQ